jgi:hypothetical protein
MAEEGKVRVRNARRDALELLKKGNKDKTVTATDDLKRSEKEIQTHTDKFTADIEKNLKAKEAVAEGRIRHPPRFHEHPRIPSRGPLREVRRRRARRAWRSNPPADSEGALAKIDVPGGIMVKSQIHAGGRGKGTFTDGFKGGVKFCKTKADAKNIAGRMIGNTLVTLQTGPAGRKVQTVYFTVASDDREGVLPRHPARPRHVTPR